MRLSCRVVGPARESQRLSTPPFPPVPCSTRIMMHRLIGTLVSRVTLLQRSFEAVSREGPSKSIN